MEIQLRDVEIQFPSMPEPLLRISDRRVRSGSRLLIRGPSGSGKTTLLHILAGLMEPRRGTASIDGIALSGLDEKQRCAWRRSGVGVVFQRLNLLGHLTALENVLLATAGGTAARARADQALQRLGLAALRERLAYRLSLGEQQRVAVARVVARRPGLILADEPTSSLDLVNAHGVMDALCDTASASGALIVTTHDTRITEHFDQVWTIEDGELR